MAETYNVRVSDQPLQVNVVEFNTDQLRDVLTQYMEPIQQKMTSIEQNTSTLTSIEDDFKNKLLPEIREIHGVMNDVKSFLDSDFSKNITDATKQAFTESLSESKILESLVENSEKTRLEVTDAINSSFSQILPAISSIVPTLTSGIDFTPLQGMLQTIIDKVTIVSDSLSKIPAPTVGGSGGGGTIPSASAPFSGSGGAEKLIRRYSTRIEELLLHLESITGKTDQLNDFATRFQFILDSINTKTVSVETGAVNILRLSDDIEDVYDQHRQHKREEAQHWETILDWGSKLIGLFGAISLKESFGYAAQFQKNIQNTATAMVGLANESGKTTDYLRQQARDLVEVSHGLVDANEAAQAQTNLYEMGISSLSRQKDLIDTLGISAVEMNVPFEELTSYAGGMAFNLRLSGKQASLLVRGTSRLSKVLGISAKHIIQVQEGAKNIFDNIRRITGESTRAVNQITKILGALEEGRGAQDLAQTVFETFTGGWNAFFEGFDKLGPIGASIMQNLQEMGVSTQEITSGQVDQVKLSEALRQSLQYTRQESQRYGLQSTAFIETFTGGLAKGTAELDNSLISISKVTRSSGIGAIREIEKIQQQLLTATDQQKTQLENQIMGLQDSIRNEFSATFADLQSGLQKKIELKDAINMDPAQFASEMKDVFNKAKPELINQIELTTKAGLKIEGLDTTTIASIEEGINNAVMGIGDNSQFMDKINNVLTNSHKQDQDLAQKQADLSAKNALDQLKAGKNLAENTILGYQLAALDAITGPVKWLSHMASLILPIAGILTAIYIEIKKIGFLRGGLGSLFGRRGGEALGAGIPGGGGTGAAGGIGGGKGGLLDKVNFKSMGKLAAKLAKGAVALIALTAAITLLGGVLIKVAKFTNFISPEEAKTVGDNTLSLLMAVGKIAGAIMLSSGALVALGFLVGIPWVAPLLAAGAAALLVLTPGLVLLSSAVVKFSSLIMSSTGVTPEEAAKTAESIAGILWSITKIAVSVTAASAGLSALAPFSAASLIIAPLLYLGAKALESLIAGVIYASKSILDAGNSVLRETGMSPEKVNKMADDISGIISSMAIISTKIIVAAGALSGAGALSPAVLIIKPFMWAGAKALRSLTTGVVKAAISIAEAGTQIVKEANLTPAEVADMAKGIEVVISSMAKITNTVNEQKDNLVSLSKINLKKTKSQIHHGTQNLSEIITTLAISAFSMTTYMEKVADNEGINPRKAKESLEIIKNLTHMLGRSKRLLKYLGDAIIPYTEPTGLLGFGKSKVEQLSESTEVYSSYFGQIIGFLTKGIIAPVRRLPLAALEMSLQKIDNLTKLLRGTGVSLTAMDNIFSKFTEGRGIFSSARISEIQSDTEVFAKEFKSILELVSSGLASESNIELSRNISTKVPGVGGSQFPVNDDNLEASDREKLEYLNQLTYINENTAETARILRKIEEHMSRNKGTRMVHSIDGALTGKRKPDTANNMVRTKASSFESGAAWSQSIAAINGLNESQNVV